MYAMVIYLAAVLWVLYIERREVYPGALKQRPEAIPVVPADASPVVLYTADGLQLPAYELAAETKSAQWCIFFHGQWGRTRWDIPKLQVLRASGLNVLMFDYRGYSGNAGQPDEPGLYRDGEAALVHLTNTKGVPANQIFAYGHSLGAAVAIDLASRVELRGVIVDGAFRSVPDCGRERYPWMPVSLLATNRFDTERKVTQLTEPILFLHGLYDKRVPVEHARKLFARTSAPKRICELNGGHEDIQWADATRFRTEIERFLKEAPSTYAQYMPPGPLPPPAWGLLPW